MLYNSLVQEGSHRSHGKNEAKNEDEIHKYVPGHTSNGDQSFMLDKKISAGDYLTFDRHRICKEMVGRGVNNWKASFQLMKASFQQN